MHRPTTLVSPTGLLGMLCSWPSCAKHGADKDGHRRMLRHQVERLGTLLFDNQKIRAGMFDGIAGVLWSIEYARVCAGIEVFTTDDVGAVARTFFSEYFARDFEYEFDLVSGLSGIGLWSLSFQDKRCAESITRTVVEKIVTQSVEEPGGMTWRTPPVRQHYVDPDQGRPEYNLGLAHGVPGVIAFLSLLAQSAYTSCASERLLGQAVNWLLCNALSDPSGGFFATTAKEETPSRLAWCYGDLGCAVSLHVAGVALGDSLIAGRAKEIALAASRRRREDSLINDSGICHGSAGAALILEYFADIYVDESISSAAQMWWQDLDADRTKSVEGEYLFWNHWTNKYAVSDGLLSGMAGVALAMLTRATKDWTWALPFCLI